MFKKDRHLKEVIPISLKDGSLFTVMSDGVILCKLINIIKPKTIHRIN